MNKLFLQSCAGILFLVLATVAAKADDLGSSIAESQEILLRQARNADIPALSKALQNSDPLIRLDAIVLIDHFQVQLPVQNVIDAMRQNAGIICGSTEATAHEEWKIMMVEYVNKLTGTNFHYESSMDEEVYARLINEIQARVTGGPSTTPPPVSQPPPSRTPMAQAQASGLPSTMIFIIPGVILLGLGCWWMVARGRHSHKHTGS